MFKTRPRQLARIGFGAVLTLGFIQIAFVTATNRAAHDAAAWLGITWLAAIVAALGGYAFARTTPRGTSERLHVASLVIPSVGLALVMPLTLHLGWIVVTGAHLRSFDEWFAMSMVFAGVAHVVFAVLAGYRARRLARGEEPMSVGFLYFVVVMCANIPLPVIPAAIVALTGLPMLPLLYGMKRYAKRERELFAQDSTDLPAAIVVAA